MVAGHGQPALEESSVSESDINPSNDMDESQQDMLDENTDQVVSQSHPESSNTDIEEDNDIYTVRNFSI